MIDIDINFSFTSDSPNYWEGFWERKDGLGSGASDPDSCSPTLKEYHRLLWSRQLPNGGHMRLVKSQDYTLHWGDMYFSSDSITTGFRYYRNREVLDKVAKLVPDYHTFVENYVTELYTIGGMIIFPVMRGSINQCRGTYGSISDRWDLTLECIRRYYAGESSPLQKVLERNKSFFDLFVDFKGYVDFFFLQDCVSPDYKQVYIWTDMIPFVDKALPRNEKEYLQWIDKCLEFVRKRNKRIKEFAATQE